MPMVIESNETILKLEHYSYQAPGKHVRIEVAEVVAGFEAAPNQWLARPTEAFSVAKPEFWCWAKSREEALTQCIAKIRSTDLAHLFLTNDEASAL